MNVTPDDIVERVATCEAIRQRARDEELPVPTKLSLVRSLVPPLHVEFLVKA